MAISNQTRVNHLTQMESDLEAVLANIREARTALEGAEKSAVYLPRSTARSYINWLKQWSFRLPGSVRAKVAV